MRSSGDNNALEHNRKYGLLENMELTFNVRIPTLYIIYKLVL